MREVDLDRLLGALEKVMGRGGSYMARCPAHEDRTPSLHITVKESGVVLWKCHAGCAQEDVTDALRRAGALPPAPERPLRTEPGGGRAWRERRAARRGPPAPRRRPPPDPEAGVDADRLWRASGPVNRGPGRVYLTDRNVWPGAEHPEIRWIGAEALAALKIKPALPGGAVGALVYRFRAPGDDEDGAKACQIEAVDARGRRHVFLWNDVKRPSIKHSDFDEGRRVFRARTGRRTAGAWICEGPMDALALARLGAMDKVNLHRASVFGAAGAGAVNSRTVAGLVGIARLAMDNDAAGDMAWERITEQLAAERRTWRGARPPRRFHDWTEALAAETGGRENPGG